jgi:glycine/D-amino acid oxidase-like deaminating enzyme
VADVAIIGAGITGLSIAFRLRERTDAAIVVLDRVGVGAGASGVQPGGVRQQWGTRVNCVMARESLRFYREAAARLEARVDPGFRPCGYLFLAHSEDALDRLRASVRLQNELSIPSRLLVPELPIEPEPRRIFFSDPVGERLLDTFVVSVERHFAAKQLADGRVLASDLAAGDRVEVRATMRSLLPRLEYVSLPHVVDGVYDTTPDRQAILGRVDDGLYVAAGFSGHGFMMAPEVGRLVAGAVLGDEPEEALQELSPERFALGRLIPEPAVV